MSSARIVRVMDTEESGMKDDPVATCRACDVPVEMKSLLSHEASCKARRSIKQTVVWGSPELVVKGPQPEAHKSIDDYRDQLASKKNRKKKSLW